MDVVNGASGETPSSTRIDAESHPASSPIDPAEERAELARVLRHPEICRSPSLVRFLTYICRKYFDGEALDIREQSIAVEALGRKAGSFDSHVDPIVRVTARALRKKLQEVYKDAGPEQLVRIRLPLGHYIPEFVRPHDVDAETAHLPESADTGDGGDSPDSGDTEASADVNLSHSRSTPPAWSKPALQVSLAACVIALVFVAGFWLGERANRPKHPAVRSLQWGDPVWSDDFDGSLSVPNLAHWNFSLGQSRGMEDLGTAIYCSPLDSDGKSCDSRHPNVYLDGAGHLILRAERNRDGAWTSGRITTRNIKDFQYGRIEARMKMPVGTGLWPSFWLAGSNLSTVGWPASGSVDIVENVSLRLSTNGLGPSMIRSTLHGPRYFASNGLWHDFKLPNGARVDDSAFHTYGIIWSPGMIQFYVDDPANIYYVQDADSIPEGGQWVFDHPFFLVLNLGVGGDWPGSPDATTPNPSDLVVDYIRVYKIPAVPAPQIEWHPIKVRSGSAASSSILLRAAAYTGRVHLACSVEPATAACQLATPIVNLSDTLTQEDTLTLSTSMFTDKGRIVASPGRYKLTLTSTTISGDHSQITVPFEIATPE